ncbi:AAA domain-containing protein [Panacagrimonas perspica]|uniref:AAA domain-containing protein n=1 Tax=Panacagrimonas perspica TaxID=381431 RepID=A0A4S3K3A6_9GAMM|nr:AAA family ATPase [Panacagrimonas perspica]TDU23286.1 AAA domain-containing protein [Panacagrimonas perspica]THD02525.1 hypothetical protein B1810_14430 [Panacagrimonas perspica]
MAKNKGSEPFNPYEGNILVDGLGPIPSPTELENFLLNLPKAPGAILEAPAYIRLHELLLLENLFVPSPTSISTAQSIDLSLRHSYRSRDPRIPANRWGEVEQHAKGPTSVRPPALDEVRGARLVTIGGAAGTGKTRTISKSLSRYRELIIHETFPGLVGQHVQAVRLSVDVPASGQLVDLAAGLMMEWDRVFTHGLGSKAARFELPLARYRHARKPSQGLPMFDEWSSVARAHCLGVLHLDEIQNFFRIPTLEQRRAKKSADSLPELSVKDDQALLRLLTWCNSMRIALVFSGTPDGMHAFARRLSVLTRVANGFFHEFSPLDGPNGPGFKFFSKRLESYQYVRNPLKLDEAARNTLHRLTASVPRILIGLWVGGQRIALERDKEDFLLTDLETAAATLLGPLRPAVQALLKGDPVSLRRYEDLMHLNDGFWKQFWR